MRKLNSFDEKMAHFLLTPAEMKAIAGAVLLELDLEAPLKRARFSEMIARQYCVRAPLSLLAGMMRYAREAGLQSKNTEFREAIGRLTAEIHDAYFNTVLLSQQENSEAIAEAEQVLASDEIGRSPSYQKLVADIRSEIEKLKRHGVDMDGRTDLLTCYYCGAFEDEDHDGLRAVLNAQKLPTGHKEMRILSQNEEYYEDQDYEGYIVTYRFQCPACDREQSQVRDSLWPREPANG